VDTHRGYIVITRGAAVEYSETVVTMPLGPTMTLGAVWGAYFLCGVRIELAYELGIPPLSQARVGIPPVRPGRKLLTTPLGFELNH